MTILAYILIIIPISALVVTLAAAVGALVIGLPLFWIPDKCGGWIRGFLCGMVAEMAGFGYGYLIFRLLVGPDSFTIVPVCVAAIPLVLPPINDLQHAKKVATLGKEVEISDLKGASAIVGAKRGAAIGEVVGWVGGIAFFGVVLRSIW